MSELIKGVVIHKGDIQSFGNYSKRILVVKTEGDYPQEISVDFGGKNSELLNAVNVGDQVDVSYNLRGRCFEKNGTKSWFNSVDGWKCFITKKGNKQNTNHSVQPPVGNDDDLPF